MKPPRAKAVSVLRATGAVLLAVAVLTGCSEGSGINTKEAKQSIVTFVEGSTDVVGDGWEVSDGPGLGKCGRGLGQEGVQYVYAKVRSASADPKADVEAVEQYWKELGVTTERYQTGGEDPILGVRGRGGPLSSSDFRADPRGYTIDGSSQCIAGDFEKMSLDSQE
ncbi:hypothetical protein EDF52_106262 [Curtobacterium sp. PhB42]|uniref:hypothetical protein n=1 Tax=unclassified Curtobacterium TaxID=257496 RepID=UPI001063232C|nr:MULTISPECIES: hypothetical protein [unclassified Curtobacterium]TDW47697.1 hypothetical protein EDF52_106262 [Curtobacterium sp. PhB42]TDW49224.1 hypothetical protein EDF47_11923 [Curtobacterium sp. PhB190]